MMSLENDDYYVMKLWDRAVLFIWKNYDHVMATAQRKTLTPIMAFNSGIVTCFARSTACATCCWCSADRNGSTWPINAFNRFAISVWNEKIKEKICMSEWRQTKRVDLEIICFNKSARMDSGQFSSCNSATHEYWTYTTGEMSIKLLQLSSIPFIKLFVSWMVFLIYLDLLSNQAPP